MSAMAQEAAPRSGGTLRIAMLVRPMADPRLFDWAEMGNIARQVIEPLVRLSPDGALVPWLLERWAMAPDARRCTLHLRPGVLWSNGDRFTAEDVLHNLRRWCDTTVPGNSMAARCAALIDPATGQIAEGAATAVDEMTVDLVLSRPDVTLLAGLSDYPALIVHRSFDATGADITNAPIGTGPFRLTAFVPGQLARVERSPSWWGGVVPLDAVEWQDLGTTPSIEVEAFRTGAVHLNMETVADYVGVLDRLGLRDHSLVTANTIVARMRVTEPPFDDPRVRRALTLAVDNGVVLALGYGGRGMVADNHHVGPMHPDSAIVPGPRPDPAEARRLLTEAGRLGHPFELISPDDDWRRNTADAIAVQLLDAGLTLRRTVIPPAQFWLNWLRYPFSVTNWSMRPLGVQVLALAYRSGAAWNETGYSDPAFDAALDAALATPDPVARRVPMHTLQTLLRDSGVIIQPYWRETHVHAAPRVRGFTLHPALEQQLEGVWLDDDA
jgi:peptide/nickel transport system substrate-binding protein